MSVLRRAYVEVEPSLDGFDTKLSTKLRQSDPGGKAGKQIGGQLNRALKRLDLDPVDVKADPKSALAAIAVTEHKLRELSGEAATVEVKVHTEKALGELGRFRKQLGNVGDDAGPEAALGFAAKFSQRIGPLLANAPLSPGLLAAAGAAAVAVSPLLGAAISGAIIGGAGIGGVVGGLIVASKDVRVQAAGKELAAGLLARLQRSAGAFVQPAIDGIHQIQGALDTIDIERIFRQSAQFVRPLAAGAASAITDVGNAIEKLVASAGPVIGVIGAGIAKIGKDLGAGLASLADNGAEASAALQTLFGIVGSSIGTTLGLVNVLTELYGISHKLGFDTGLQLILKLTGSAMKDTGDSAKKTGAETAGMGEDFQKATDKAKVLAEQQAQLRVFTDAVAAAQGGLQHSLESLGGATSLQGQRSAALRTVMDNLYGATIRQSDANQDYEASWDSLSAAVKGNSRSLDIHTAAGRTNRDALKGLIGSTNDLYIADINAGVSIAQATKKHENRIGAIKEESKRLGLNTGKTQDLINTYGRIPKKKQTDLIVGKLGDVVNALKDLYLFQRALADGIPIASERGKLNKPGPDKKFGGYADGGQIGGWSPHSKADNIPAWLTAKEWVHPVDSVDYYGPQIMTAIQKREVPREVLAGFASGALGKLGDLPIFAAGGQVGPVDTSRVWPFIATMANTKVMSRAEAASKVPIGAGPGGAFARAQDGKPYIWAAAGPGGYDCSGIVSAVYNVLHGRSPYNHTFSTGSLPGHWFTKPGIGGPLTAAWSNPGESPASSTTGHMMGMVNGLTFESSGSRGVHLGASTRRLTDFAHIAHYNRGGQVPFASYDSGGYLPPGISLAHNGTGRPEPVGAGGEVHFHFHGPVASKQAAKAMVLSAYNDLVNDRKIRP